MGIIDIARKIGIDKSIAYSSGANIVSAIVGLGTVFFVGAFLSPAEQGYYFTFGSILALQSFFDLGLTGIMQQYVAHEHAHLKWDVDGSLLLGEEKYKSRLASLLHFCVKWYGIISIIFFAVLVIIGFVFFQRYGTSGDVEWKWPWVLICFTNSINLFLGPINSFYRGLDKVKEMSAAMFWGNILVPLISWPAFFLGAKLYVVAIISFCRVFAIAIYMLQPQLRKILINLWNQTISDRVGYMKEIFPFQWKIALSWISGYFIFQLFNPVLFATDGAVVAGQMGMTLQVLNAVSGLAMNWISTKVPLLSRLIENKQYQQLDSVFNKCLTQQSLVCLTCLIIIFLGVTLLNVTGFVFNGSLLDERFLPTIPLIIMMVPIFTNQFKFSWATYLRCHKEEPFLVLSVVSGVYCLLSTLIFGNLFGLYGICIGYTAWNVLVTMPWSHHIFVTKKHEWHTDV